MASGTPGANIGTDSLIGEKELPTHGDSQFASAGDTLAPSGCSRPRIVRFREVAWMDVAGIHWNGGSIFCPGDLRFSQTNVSTPNPHPAEPADHGR